MLIVNIFRLVYKVIVQYTFNIPVAPDLKNLKNHLLEFNYYNFIKILTDQLFSRQIPT